MTFDYDVGEDEDDDVDKEGICQVEWQTDSRVGSRKNIQHRAGGGDVKVVFIKIMIFIMFLMLILYLFITQNIQHRAPGGGIKIMMMIMFKCF